MRIDDESDYREGIVLDRPSKQGKGSLVNCGMRKVRLQKQGILKISKSLGCFIQQINIHLQLTKPWTELFSKPLASCFNRKFGLISSCSLGFESRFSSTRRRNKVEFSSLMCWFNLPATRTNTFKKLHVFNEVFLSSSDNKVFKGVVVAPHVPRTEGGLYWGYSVRLASCLSKTPTLREHVRQSDSDSA